MDKLRDYLNFDAIDELHMFMSSTKKTTGKMKYDRMVKIFLERLRPIIQDYLTEQDKRCKECVTLSQLQELKIAPITNEMKELILQVVDHPKDLSLVEKTYLALDMFRSVTGEIGTTITKMVIHYGNAIKAAPTIIQQNGKSY